MVENLTTNLIRKHCLDCCGDAFKAVLWCSAHDCRLWPFRLGMRPATVRSKYGPGLVTPSMMPAPSVDLDGLPLSTADASTLLNGGVAWVPDRSDQDPELLAARREYLKRARQAKRSVEFIEENPATPPGGSKHQEGGSSAETAVLSKGGAA
jgi:hypothetical protein